VLIKSNRLFGRKSMSVAKDDRGREWMLQIGSEGVEPGSLAL
jgi:hypothetical protein